jgi:hypothetical protein
MSENLPPNTSKKLRSLCRKIAETHHLDEHARDELFLLMEKKLNEYISGKEILTEEEAFILVQEHFGKPQQIRSLLEEVYLLENQIGYFRKLGAIFLATFLTTGLIKIFLDYFLWSFSPKFWHSIKLLNYLRIESVLAFDFEFLLSFTLFGYLLYRWQNGMRNGVKQWFETINSWIYFFVTFILAFIPLLILAYLLPRAYQYPVYHFPGTGVHFELFLPYIFICFGWIWWFDEPVKRVRNIILGFFSWFYFSFLWEQYIGTILFAIRNHQEKLIQYFLNETWRYLNVFNLISQNVIMELYKFIACGLASIAFYVLITRIIERRRKEQAELIQH